jgi:hypothetical protein
MCAAAGSARVSETRRSVPGLASSRRTRVLLTIATLEGILARQQPHRH